MSSGTHTPDPGARKHNRSLGRHFATAISGVKQMFNRRRDEGLGNPTAAASLSDVMEGQDNVDLLQSDRRRMQNVADSLSAQGIPAIPQAVAAAHGETQSIMSSGPSQAPPLYSRNKVKLAGSVTGRVIQNLVKELPDIADGNPVKMAFSIAKLVIQTKNAYTGNKDTLHKHILNAANRLFVVETATGDGARLPKKAEAAMDQFSLALLNALFKLIELKQHSRITQILDNNYYTDKIAECFKEIGRATEDFQLAMAIEIQKAAARMDEGLKQQSLQRLKPSTDAQYNAQISGKSLQRVACTTGTRTNILKKIDHWVDEASQNTVFWLTGQAGAGKTTILYTITEKADSGLMKTRLGGNFFCSRQFSETREPKRIIPTVVYQLAQVCRPYGDALYAATISGAHPNPFDTVSLDMKTQLMSLLVIPWQQCQAKRREEKVSYLVVIDALDEMDGQGATNFLRHLFDMMNAHKLSGLKFLVASRTDPEIKGHIQAFLPRTELWLQHVLADEASADISRYLEENMPALSKDYHHRIEKEANGLFIYAATAVRFIKPRLRMSTGEQQLLADQLLSYSRGTGLNSPEFLVDALYQHIMVQAFSNLPVKLHAHRLKILHFFLSTHERETPATIAAILGDNSDETARLLVDDLHSVLYLQEDGRIFWVWDALSGNLLHTLKQHTKSVKFVSLKKLKGS
ncbi:hypothetical protein D9619_009600 [Psilocybe cf. subviscida]|uniref:Nephrocystin 3-like N-terminal domain-containing protein n=1 Tax=Psilocybe cf. subviscida TaxID=2480587 RepID=A0A8H5BKS8_9AGAR|nr:hypothetical protein D9619_009600 [Psilocybe cf. subviscida]